MEKVLPHIGWWNSTFVINYFDYRAALREIARTAWSRNPWDEIIMWTDVMFRRQ